MSRLKVNLVSLLNDKSLETCGMPLVVGMTWVSPCCCDDVSDGYRDKGTRRSEVRSSGGSTAIHADNLHRDPIDFGSFVAEIESLMPQFSPNKILSTGVTICQGLFSIIIFVENMPSKCGESRTILGMHV